jgi:N-methylhydantoinase B
MRNPSRRKNNSFDPIRLEVFKHLFSAIPEEMGAVLRKASFSPNIKERRDFSCALFNNKGLMISQAAHIPVHLGSMPMSVEVAMQRFLTNLAPGDMVILNNPFLGGTHLPDITLVMPVFHGQSHIGFVANRAHHADVGGITPGSMPVAREIFQEGLIIPPIKIIDAGDVNQAVIDMILANVRTPEERSGDLWAQIAANERGANRLKEMTEHYGESEVAEYMDKLLAYSELLTRKLLVNIPDGVYKYEDVIDDDGIDNHPIPIQVSITVSGDQVEVDFSGSATQVTGSLNAVYAITLSAVYYVFRCLIGLDAPNNSGCLAPIKVIAPAGSIVNALQPAPVAGGNVETSQRIVDVLLGALAQALPGIIPAASQGTMNNITIGGWDSRTRQSFAYYETIGGGMGASPTGDGPSGLHSHMTNTLNTPVEALEYAYPLRVLRYEIRHGSGGKGKFYGGDGIRKDIQMLCDTQVTLLTDRRKTPPYGLQGGQPGERGENCLITNGVETRLPSKGSFHVLAGEVISIRTPGGGGFGQAKGHNG